MPGYNRRYLRSPNGPVYISPSNLEFIQAKIVSTKQLKNGSLYLVDIIYKPNAILKTRLQESTVTAQMGDRILRIKRNSQNVFFEETISYFKPEMGTQV